MFKTCSLTLPVRTKNKIFNSLINGNYENMELHTIADDNSRKEEEGNEEVL